MADGSGKLKGLREQMVAVAHALADERRTQTGSSPVPVNPAAAGKAAKPVIDASALRTDERQRLARERREEKERINAAKEKELIEKEKKAKQQYDKQMEEKQKKLEEQKHKDEQKRAAAEEKRKQRLQEDKDRREATLRRTLERRSHLDQRQKRWSWSGSADGDKPSSQGGSSPTSVDLADKPSKSELRPEDKTSRRSVSASNLKQADTTMNKPLSSSSATLLSASEKGTKKRSASLSRLSSKTSPSPQPQSPRVPKQDNKGGTPQKRSSSLSRLSNKKSPPPSLEKKEDSALRPQTTPLDSSVLSRLLTPTQSSLARSKSAAALSADGKESPATTINTPPYVSKGPMRSRSIDRLKSPRVPSSGASSAEPSQKPESEKASPPSAAKRPPSPNVTIHRRSPSPATSTKRAPSPTLDKKSNSSTSQKNRPPSPSLLRQRPPSPSVTHKPIPIQRPALTPTVLTATKKSADSEPKPKEKEPSSEPKSVQQTSSDKEATTAKTKEDSSSKNMSGSNTAEEAARILAENRRLAREQREREEKERIQREEEEKIRREEMARKAEEEKLRRQEEEKIMEEKRKLEREEEEKRAQEEKIRRELEEQERMAELQQQREEAEAKALEEAEKQRIEREKIMQKNKQERLERKKRIEEIMKRTRKAEQADSKNEEMSDRTEEEENENQNIDGRINGIDFCEDGDGPRELSSPDSLSQDGMVEEGNTYVNGDKMEHGQKNGHVADTEPASEATEDSDEQSPDSSHLDNDDKNYLSGKSSRTFEEIIDLGIYSKSSSLLESPVNDDLIEAATVTPKLAFEEGQFNSLPTTIETAAEI